MESAERQPNSTRAYDHRFMSKLRPCSILENIGIQKDRRVNVVLAMGIETIGGN